MRLFRLCAILFLSLASLHVHAALPAPRPFEKHALSRIQEPVLRNPLVQLKVPEKHDPFARATNMIIAGFICTVVGGGAGVATMVAVASGRGYEGSNLVLALTSVLFVLGVSLIYAGWSIHKRLNGSASPREPMEI